MFTKLCFVFLFLLPIEVMAIAAYPGAVGGGAASVGGRGGVVIQVTNLNDSGTGSFRACLESAVQHRTCVFTVAGTIQMTSTVEIGTPYLTVAGQTAPGGGILVSGVNRTYGNMFRIWTHDVIFQYIKMRNGYNNTCNTDINSGCGIIATFDGATNVILDHLSSSWNINENLGGWAFNPGMHDITYSYCLAAEGLTGHATEMLVGAGNPTNSADITNFDMHHNLFMNNSHRAPLFKGKSSRIVNNIIYNQRNRCNQIRGQTSTDIIGNLFRQGPGSGSFHEIQADNNADGTVIPGNPSIYALGNKGWSQPIPANNQWVLTAQVGFENGPENASPAPSGWQRFTPLTNTAYPIVAESVASLEINLIPIVGDSRRLGCDGAWIANRDTEDLKLINQYNTNTGNTATYDNESFYGGFPTIAAGTPCSDKDADGMPDVWEENHGYNPNNPANRNTVAPNGYTYLENFLNGQ